MGRCRSAEIIILRREIICLTHQRACLFQQQVVELYAYGEAKPPAREQLWHEITGFLEAGQLLGNVTTEELQVIIDEEHIAAFGITREERQLIIPRTKCLPSSHQKTLSQLSVNLSHLLLTS